MFDQLRFRRLAEEQRETYACQQEAAVRLKELNHAQAEAERQTHLTATKVEIEIASNRGAAQLAEAQNMAKREVTLAEGSSRAARLIGEGDAAKIRQIGEAEALVSQQKVDALGDPRLYALNQITTQLAASKQPLLPEKLILFSGQGGDGAGSNPGSLFHSLLQVLTTWQVVQDEKRPKQSKPRKFSNSSKNDGLLCRSRHKGLRHLNPATNISVHPAKQLE